MQGKKFLISSLFLILFLSFNCNRQKNTVIDLPDNGVFIFNEGNYTNGNSSLSFIDLQTDSVFNDIFFKANQLPLGDVAQSGAIINGKLYIVVNNSGKIWITDTRFVNYDTVITGLGSPRYILPLPDNKAYVSDLYSPYITILDLQKNEKSGTVFVGASTERMLLYGNYVYVCNWSYGNKIYKINFISNTLTDSLTVQYQPNSAVVDKDGYLWILSDGGNMPDTNENYLPALTKININDFSIDTVFYFASRRFSPMHLITDNSKENLFFLNSAWNNSGIDGGIFKMNIYADKLPSQPFIPENGHLFYSFAISTSGDFFVADAVDYTSRGKIYRYNAAGNLTKIYTVGIIPGFFLFKETAN